ncbi:NAD-dependent epimerase/dehydratase family protein [Enterococcus dongliensis]|uniref:NAD-dependent epimerase/dehydratase family protein n=1 Tax=Enterococcus dongliensis TaxID=2559925 RepID=UPI002891B340|nr:NAD-dependent epimerase/dehydratase family protein [Enterococcus dongliensis]MDT2633448.1 NAD-dependent epimerase/dehydratase family protein [Enterococcus dongliensis]MDT2641330.1 NAD-dependent epimerase/dehydratase family protein [Enterococcus dongliensis]MDT2646550.1 NAD-dependent epimerase/dehydratase family protein [Enterococcus dongliensis]MDT2710547.1 NAD-dependent epimerase/dehydratase family protein [Enterococcus dongliensis]
MNTYLITGGAGFIGSTLANHVSKENSVIVIDDLSMGKEENLVKNSNLRFIKGSVTDSELMDEILSKNTFDYIFHFAAVASVADSVERPVDTHQVNFESVLMLLELVRKYQKNLKRLIFSSSAAVYGDEPTLPKKEESAICPLTPYAIDKFAAEQYVLAYNHLYGINTSAVRFFNVYGPNQNPESPYSGVISILVDRYKKVQTGEDTQFTLFGDGSQSRDFVFIEDVIQALLLIADKKESLGKQFNVGTGNAITLNELIAVIDKSLGIKLPIAYQPERDGDIKESVSDISRLKGLGYEPNFSIQEGMDKYLTSEDLV